MKHNHWDVARAANTMAVVSTVCIDPTKITTRIKNKLTKWLDQGHLDGGYRSEARKLGDMLADKFNLPMTMTSWRGVHVRCGNKPADDEISELLQTDWTAMLIERPEMNRGWYKDRYEDAQRYLRGHVPDTIHLYIHNKEFRQQIIDVQAKYITDKDRAAIKQAIDAVNGTEPIHIFTYQ